MALLPSCLPLDADDAAFVERLDAVVDGILEQRLQDQRWDRRIHRQPVDLPVDLQALPEAQSLDALVGARDLDLVRQRDPLAMLAQRRAEQVREVGDRLFRHSRVAARERGDGVHAVEQEMRTDARLQRAHAALRLGLDIGLPLVRDVEVAQCNPGRDRANGEVLQLQAQMVGGRSRRPRRRQTGRHSTRTTRRPRSRARSRRARGQARAPSPSARPDPTGGRVPRTRRPPCRAPPTAGTARPGRVRSRITGEMPWRASVMRMAVSAAIRITASTLCARQKSGR